MISRSKTACLWGAGLGVLWAFLLPPKPICERCGNAHHVRRVCRAVPSEKEIKDVSFAVEEEDICLPGPPRGRRSCQDTPPCGEQCRGGRVRRRQRLEKKDVFEKKPSVRFEVEYICDECHQDQARDGCSAPRPVGSAP